MLQLCKVSLPSPPLPPPPPLTLHLRTPLVPPLHPHVCRPVPLLTVGIVSIAITCMVSWNHSVEHMNAQSSLCVVFVSGRVWSEQRDLTLSPVPFVIAINVYSLKDFWLKFYWTINIMNFMGCVGLGCCIFGKFDTSWPKFYCILGSARLTGIRTLHKRLHHTE